MKEVQIENQLVERGATMLEYLFMAMLIMVVCLIGVQTIGLETSESFSNLGVGLVAN